jgi:hypothetical protein
MNELTKFKRECGIMVILITILYFGLLLVVNNNNRNEINILRGQVLIVAEAANKQTEINRKLLEVIELQQNELNELSPQ